VGEEFVEEIKSEAKLFLHEQSGAKLLVLDNDDDNKVFSVTFRTPPPDDTGLPHILEHSVLCGSRKFPMKEPFVELVKGSLNTFLNAMTFPDKTMYPVASRNAKDFRNLMDVYLDAVFYAKITETKEILMQEGWHYELAAKDKPLNYKGVVYNEMKGVFSSPDALLERKIFQTLFPDTAYGVESGGDPDFIPDLTYENFLDFYQKYYHPSNSYLFLYGDFGEEGILDNLKFLHTEYLKDFRAIEIDSSLALQQPPPGLQEKDFVFEYPVSPQEASSADKTFLALNFVTGRAVEADTYLGLSILEHLLLETPAAPLKKAIISAGIGKEVFGVFTKSILQPVFTIGVSGANEKDMPKLRQVVSETLTKLAAEGIEKKLIASSINLFEFHLREANYGSRPKGLIYNIKCMDSWLYDESPLTHLAYQGALTAVKAALTKPYFENMIKKYLLHNEHTAAIILKPNAKLAQEKAAELKEKLAAYKKSLSAKDLEKIIADTKALKIRQETPDTPEVLEKIPLLNLSDIEKKVEELPLTKKEIEGAKILFHPLYTNGIAYTALYFDASLLPEKLIPYGYLLAEILGKVSVKSYDYAELSKEINLHTGGFSYNLTAYSDQNDHASYQPKFVVKGKALLSKTKEMLTLLGEVAGSSKFDDQERLTELIKEIKTNWDNALFSRGQQIVTARLLSYFSPAANYLELGKLTFYKFICDLEKNLEQKLPEITKNLAQAAALIFTQENLLTSVTCSDKDYPLFAAAFSRLYRQLGSQKKSAAQYAFTLEQKNEGLMTPGKVQYVAKGGNFRKFGYEYTGSMKVLESILRYDYLWSHIRVRGGAYGAFANFDRNGNLIFGSYRDPNLIDTLKVYDNTAQYLADFTADNVSAREMTKYIIGAISSLDTPLTPQQKGERAATNYLRRVSQSDLEQERAEVLSTTQKNISHLSNLVKDVMSENYLCVLGSEQKIRESQEEEHIFKNLVDVSDE
jgi:Zn-dependent M16 (insulinase) family peptidase